MLFRSCLSLLGKAIPSSILDLSDDVIPSDPQLRLSQDISGWTCRAVENMGTILKASRHGLTLASATSARSSLPSSSLPWVSSSSVAVVPTSSSTSSSPFWVSHLLHRTLLSSLHPDPPWCRRLTLPLNFTSMRCSAFD